MNNTPTLAFWILVIVASTINAHESTVQPIPEFTYSIKPLALHLQVNRETRLHFKHDIAVGLPDPLKSILRAETINQSLYLRPQQEFSTQRILIRNQESGRMIVLDIDANKKNDWVHDIRIRSKSRQENSETDDINAVVLTKFAAQQLLAPRRLQRTHPQVRRVSVKSSPGISLMRYGDATEVTLGCWHHGELYVTAIELRNNTSSAIVLDPTTLRGTWVTATFHHSRLLPKGQRGDRSIVYLVSRDTYKNSLRGEF